MSIWRKLAEHTHRETWNTQSFIQCCVHDVIHASIHCHVVTLQWILSRLFKACDAVECFTPTLFSQLKGAANVLMLCTVYSPSADTFISGFAWDDCTNSNTDKDVINKQGCESIKSGGSNLRGMKVKDWKGREKKNWKKTMVEKRTSSESQIQTDIKNTEKLTVGYWLYAPNLRAEMVWLKKKKIEL